MRMVLKPKPKTQKKKGKQYDPFDWGFLFAIGVIAAICTSLAFIGIIVSIADFILSL